MLDEDYFFKEDDCVRKYIYIYIYIYIHTYLAAMTSSNMLTKWLLFEQKKYEL